ncbi:hypothetical protein KEJ39_05570, partial [Candidatus Bathyarchaeota archaeon]|nr:hypothetical protein [Candidatus Bathyarchaeota archaeon]
KTTEKRRTVIQGSSALYDIRVVNNSALSAFSFITLSATGLPSGSDHSFIPDHILSASTPHRVTLNITTSPTIGVGVGKFLILISASTATAMHQIAVVLNVVEATDFALAISPPSRTVSQGEEATYTITATFSGGFSSPIALNHSNTPVDSNASFDSDTLTTASPSTTFRISTNLGTATGTRVF